MIKVDSLFAQMSTFNYNMAHPFSFDFVSSKKLSLLGYGLLTSPFLKTPISLYDSRSFMYMLMLIMAAHDAIIVGLKSRNPESCIENLII